MKPQLGPGAREQLSLIYADLYAALDYIREDSPGAADKLIRRVIGRIQDEVEPRLQRASTREPTLEQRMEALEQQLQQLLDKQEGTQ